MHVNIEISIINFKGNVCRQFQTSFIKTSFLKKRCYLFILKLLLNAFISVVSFTSNYSSYMFLK
jgi:hypothetical protein